MSETGAWRYDEEALGRSIRMGRLVWNGAAALCAAWMLLLVGILWLSDDPARPHGLRLLYVQAILLPLLLAEGWRFIRDRERERGATYAVGPRSVMRTSASDPSLEIPLRGIDPPMGSFIRYTAGSRTGRIDLRFIERRVQLAHALARAQLLERGVEVPGAPPAPATFRSVLPRPLKLRGVTPPELRSWVRIALAILLACAPVYPHLAAVFVVTLAAGAVVVAPMLAYLLFWRSDEVTLDAGGVRWTSPSGVRTIPWTGLRPRPAGGLPSWPGFVHCPDDTEAWRRWYQFLSWWLATNPEVEVR